MSPGEQDSFDMSTVLESIDCVTESIEAHFEIIARSLQDSFLSLTWLPDAIKPKTHIPSPRHAPPTRSPQGFVGHSTRWISEHRAATAAIIAFIGTGALIIWRRRVSERTKRRAKRARNGARTEIIILAGSPHSPLTRSISHGLERRGFIVYIPVNSVSEEQLVQAESRSDIKPLNFDISSIESTENAVRKLTNHLATVHQPIPNHTPYKLRLAAFILLPSHRFPIGAISSISPSTWSDVLNTDILAPFMTLHAFLPLITSQHTTLLCVSSSINPSLTPPLHAAESVVSGGVQQYISTLRKETSGQGVNVVDVKLGHLDIDSTHGNRKQLVISQSSSRAAATKQRMNQLDAERQDYKGSPLRELHNGIFDAIVRGKGENGTVFIGRGSRTYDLVGKWVPSGLVGWMLGRVTAPVELPPDRTMSAGSLDESTDAWEKLERSA